MEKSNSIQQDNIGIEIGGRLTIDEAVKTLRDAGYFVELDTRDGYTVVAQSQTQEIRIEEDRTAWEVFVIEHPYKSIGKEIPVARSSLSQFEAVEIALDSIEAGVGQ